MKVAAGFDPGSGMIEQLRELAEAEPFKPFSVRLQTGEEYEIETRKAYRVHSLRKPQGP
jgi:hypothetical protein